MVSRLIAELAKYDQSIVTFGNPATEQEIKETEEFIGQALPEEYKEFIRRCNGVEFMFDYILMVGNNVPYKAYSMNDVYNFEHYEVDNEMPSYLIPFSPDGYGNHYCFDMRNGGVIVFWQHDLNYTEFEPEIVYNSMVDMIQEVFIDWNRLNYDGTPKE